MVETNGWIQAHIPAAGVGDRHIHEPLYCRLLPPVLKIKAPSYTVSAMNQRKPKQADPIGENVQLDRAVMESTGSSPSVDLVVTSVA